MIQSAAFGARSLGLKLMLVGALAFLLWIPAMMVHSLVWERSTRSQEVKDEIFAHEGGRQIISGPVVLVPAVIDTGKVTRDGDPITRSTLVAFTPQKLDLDADVRTEMRHRSIYEATVYSADIEMTGRFGAFSPPNAADGAMRLLWDQAVLALKFSDQGGLKGIREMPKLNINGKPNGSTFEPDAGTVLASAASEGAMISAPGIHTALPLSTLKDGFTFSLTLPLSGGGALYFSSVGEETVATMKADWAHPSFQGAFLPDRRDIGEEGFTANWTIPYLARNLARSFFVTDNLYMLENGATFGVEFYSVASPYQSVVRALKYAMLFLGVVFLTFFLFEATTGARAHPAQYLLLGFAQVIFYLLVLALSEHIGFEAAFAATASATVTLSGLYAATVFSSRVRGFIAFLAFSGAYALIYLLMKSEDYALLIGSVTAFTALALTMFVTRNLDWYGAQKKFVNESA